MPAEQGKVFAAEKHRNEQVREALQRRRGFGRGRRSRSRNLRFRAPRFDGQRGGRRHPWKADKQHPYVERFSRLAPVTALTPGTKSVMGRQVRLLRGGKQPVLRSKKATRTLRTELT